VGLEASHVIGHVALQQNSPITQASYGATAHVSVANSYHAAYNESKAKHLDSLLAANTEVVLLLLVCMQCTHMCLSSNKKLAIYEGWVRALARQCLVGSACLTAGMLTLKHLASN
jgi:hypothetical protein